MHPDDQETEHSCASKRTKFLHMHAVTTINAPCGLYDSTLEQHGLIHSKHGYDTTLAQHGHYSF